MIKDQISEVRQRIKNACARSGRNPEDVTLVAVSKTKPVDMIREAMETGILDYGENKAAELKDKYEQLPKDLRFHMIGHLQRNKVKQVLGRAVLIHSVDSCRLAKQIEEEAERLGFTVSVLLEVNVGAEESKFGFTPEETKEAVREISSYPHIKIMGLMTIAPFVENPEENRDIFKKLYQLYVDINGENIDNVSMSVLSMGMTGDYEVAVEEGATIVRVGTGIFGTRNRIGESKNEHIG